jgi:hypothetical protein
MSVLTAFAPTFAPPAKGHSIAPFKSGGSIMRSTELLDCQNLEPGSLIDVETTSRHYRIECLGGSTIRVSGHPQICPTPVIAQLEGSVTNEGKIENGIIERGMRLMFLLPDHVPVTTSKVLHVRLSAN